MRHPLPNPCFPKFSDLPVELVVLGLYEGVCPFGHTLHPQPVPPGWWKDGRAAACHGCCPCTQWLWTDHSTDGLPAYCQFREHIAAIPEGDHC